MYRLDFLSPRQVRDVIDQFNDELLYIWSVSKTMSNTGSCPDAHLLFEAQSQYSAKIVLDHYHLHQESITQQDFYR